MKEITKNAARMYRGIVNRILWSIIGVSALVWFLIRVLPKPSRAAYPCQRVAFPIASSFVLWVAGLLGARALFLKGRQLAARARYYAALVCFVFCALTTILWFATSWPETVFGDPWVPIDPVCSPMGTPRGTHPGRVVWTHDPSVTRWDGSSTSRWWNDANTIPAGVSNMLSTTLRRLTAKTSDTNAWDELFRHFNQRHGRGDVGYQAGQRIAIKLNCNNSEGHTGTPDNRQTVAPQLIHALLEQLVGSAGVTNQSLITVCDPSRFIGVAQWNACTNDFPNVQFVDQTGGAGRIAAQPAMDTPIHFGDTNTYFNGATYPARSFVDADYVINLALLRGHNFAGVTLTAKNHFGSLWVNYTDFGRGWTPMGPDAKKGLHGYINPSTNDFIPGIPARPMGSYNALVDLIAHKDLGEKTFLFMIDGLYAALDAAGNPILRWQTAPFTNYWTASLFASQDGVAIDSVALDLLHSEPPYRSNLVGSVDNYLHEAALADDPPSGTFYDPEGDGIRAGSLGVHEHWNNDVDKQYSRNLKTGLGIELVRSDAEAFASVEISIYSVTPDSGSYRGGYPVTIAGTNLGNGLDITNVTLCGVAATNIELGTQSATQVVVWAGMGAGGPAGDVVVYSTSCGTSIKTNAFTYLEAGIRVLGTNGAVATNNEAASAAKGTAFGSVVSVISNASRTLSINNNGNTNLYITGVSTSGANAAAFAISGVPAIVAPGGVSNFVVTFSPPSAGTFSAALSIANNFTNANPYIVNFTGTGDRRSQTIDFPAIADQLATAQVGLSATAIASSLPVSFTKASGPGSITGTNLTFTGAGAVIIVASQAGNGNWYPAPSVTNAVIVTKDKATMTLNNMTQTYDGSARVVGATTVPDGLSVTIAYNGSVTAPTAAGNYAVTGVVISDVYQGSTNGTLTVNKADQTITFPAIPDQMTTSRVTLEATASSGLAVSYSATGPAVLNGNTLSFSGAGTVSIVASHSGNANWNAAANVTKTVTVNAAPLPSTPAGVSASDGAHTDKVRVTWNASSDATGYQVWRSMSNNTAMAYNLVTTATTTYDDLTAATTPGTILYYWVKAVNAAGASSFSASDSGFLGVVGPLITANRLLGNVYLNSGDPVTIAVQMMNTEPYAGNEVDWWIIAFAYTGQWFYMNNVYQWTPFSGDLASCHPVYQGLLANLPSTPVLSGILPIGTYGFWFAVDYPMNGVMNGNAMLYDNVTVFVQ